MTSYNSQVDFETLTTLLPYSRPLMPGRLDAFDSEMASGGRTVEDQPDETLTLSINGSTATFQAGGNSGDDIVEWTLDIEDEWLVDLLDELRGDDVLFDVGANLGVYSCFCLDELAGGSVIAFEPFPPNVEQLKTNLALNDGCSRVLSKALSDETGVKTFTPADTNDVGHAIGTIDPKDGSDGARIETVRGDELVRREEIPVPNLVKIDVEGSEPLVLDGMTETLSRPECRLVYCEVHLPKDSRPSVRDYGSSPEEVKEALRQSGFEIVSVERRNQELHLKAST